MDGPNRDGEMPAYENLYFDILQRRSGTTERSGALYIKAPPYLHFETCHRHTNPNPKKQSSPTIVLINLIFFPHFQHLFSLILIINSFLFSPFPRNRIRHFLFMIAPILLPGMVPHNNCLGAGTRSPLARRGSG